MFKMIKNAIVFLNRLFQSIFQKCLHLVDKVFKIEIVTN